MGYWNEVTESFLHRFKAGDVIDVKDVRRKGIGWTGPHKLLVYNLDPPRKDAKPAAYMQIDLGDGKKLGRWLIEGEQQVIRHHIPEEQKRRVRVKRLS